MRTLGHSSPSSSIMNEMSETLSACDEWKGRPKDPELEEDWWMM